MKSKGTISKYGIHLQESAFSLTMDLKINVNKKNKLIRTFQLAEKNTPKIYQHAHKKIKANYLQKKNIFEIHQHVHKK